MNDELLTISSLNAGYGGQYVLNDFSLNIPKGQQIGLIGPNGCGKSSLLKSITANIPETVGKITFNNKIITNMETNHVINQGIGYMKQTHNIFTGLTVKENLEIASTNNRARNSQQLDLLLNAFPILAPLMEMRAGLMSGGERQALAASMVLSHKLSLLLLDEPLAGLSVKSATELLRGISVLQQEEGFSMVIVEHRLDLIQPYVDRVIVMVRGEIYEDTTDTKILSNQQQLEKHFLS